MKRQQTSPFVSFVRQPAAPLLLLVAMALPAAADDYQVVISQRDTIAECSPPLAQNQYQVQLVLDDDAAESDIGVVTSSGAGRQFLWYNRFTPTDFPLQLEQIWVLFPAGDNMAEGNAVQLVIYHDADGDPGNGATLISSFNVTIQAVDGITFSVYDLVPPVEVPDAGDVLVGVVNRFVTTGVTSTTQPAAIDTSTAQGRSWIGIWSGDPPDPPQLPASGLHALVDRFQAGNWMIRAFGTVTAQPPPSPPIPVLGIAGLAALLVLLALAGSVVLRR